MASRGLRTVTAHRRRRRRRHRHSSNADRWNDPRTRCPQERSHHNGRISVPVGFRFLKAAFSEEHPLHAQNCLPRLLPGFSWGQNSLLDTCLPCCCAHGHDSIFIARHGPRCRKGSERTANLKLYQSDFRRLFAPSREPSRRSGGRLL